MKTIKLTAITGISYLILLTACSKEKEVVETVIVKKCTDSTSTNFNKEGDCIYPADVLVGNWNVTEENLNSGVTTNAKITATITKHGNDKVFVKYSRTDNPIFNVAPDTLYINWTRRKIDGYDMSSQHNQIVDGNNFSFMFSNFGPNWPMGLHMVHRFKRQ